MNELTFVENNKKHKEVGQTISESRMCIFS